MKKVTLSFMKNRINDTVPCGLGLAEKDLQSPLNAENKIAVVNRSAFC
jgi:hypothetical protein